MDTTRDRNALLGSVLGVLLLALALVAFEAVTPTEAEAAESDARFFDRSAVRVSTGEISIDPAARVWTGFLKVIDCTPQAGEAMLDVQVVIDLDKATSGWATTATTETIRFAVQRAVDGTNYRTDLTALSATCTGDAADGRSITLDVGTVGPDEKFTVAAILSAEVVSTTVLPFVVYYRSPNRAVITPTAN